MQLFDFERRQGVPDSSQRIGTRALKNSSRKGRKGLIILMDV